MDTSCNFTVDWFSKRASLWETHLGGLRGAPNVRYLEIGTFEGRSLVWVLQNLLTDASSQAHVIDPFTGSVEHAHDKDRFGASTLYETFQRNIAAYRDRVVVHVGQSQKLLHAHVLGDQPFNLIYVDGSHRAFDVFRDAVRAWKILAPGGVIIFDDYLWTTMAGEFQRPKLGVDLFMRLYRRHYDVLFMDYQVALVKRSTATSQVLPEPLLFSLFYPLASWLRVTQRSS
ncbi:MAG: class I SAM-dependent methyltransferase [Vicinamibacterales bacterium]